MLKKSTLLILFIICSTLVYAQQSYDIILRTDGEEMVGKVSAIDDNEVTFYYKSEDISYSVKTSEIVKITFSSGRIQFFQNQGDINKSGNLGSHHNKVAILPFAYITDERNGSESISERIQAETYSIYRKHNKGLDFQDPKNTNALLIKAGVTNNNINGYTMGELCQILDVEYIIQGTISVERTSENSITSSSSTSSRRNDRAYVDRHGHLVGDIYGSNRRNSSNQTRISTTIENFSTSMIMNIYNDRGENIFSQDHTAFWNTQDAYKITLKYLAKRTPFYKK